MLVKFPGYPVKDDIFYNDYLYYNEFKLAMTRDEPKLYLRIEGHQILKNVFGHYQMRIGLVAERDDNNSLVYSSKER